MYLFQQLKDLAKNQNFKNVQQAREWYRDTAMKLNKKQVSHETIMNTAGAFKVFQNIGAPAVGKMFMFIYDAKHKDTLPFFDQFPLVFPIEFYNDGFLGINLHYLPPFARAQLMDALYSTANNQKFNTSTRLVISYKILKAASTKFAGFEECVKRYLFSQVRSVFHYVNPTDWDKALMLPMQKWHINPNKKYSSKKSPPY